MTFLPIPSTMGNGGGGAVSESVRKILVDADACPVVDITLRLAAAAGVPVILLCDTAHQLERPGARTIVVEKGADSVDFKLVNLVSSGDIVVTQNYGLAAMCLAKGAKPVHQNGILYTNENIDELLYSRYIGKSCAVPVCARKVPRRAPKRRTTPLPQRCRCYCVPPAEKRGCERINQRQVPQYSEPAAVHRQLFFR